MFLDKFRHLSFIKFLEKFSCAKMTTAQNIAPVKSGAMQTERFVKSAVIKSDSLLKSVFYAKTTLQNKVML